jgi:hypothetical protein
MNVRAHVAQRRVAYARQRGGLRAQRFQALPSLREPEIARHVEVGHHHMFGGEAGIQMLQITQAAHEETGADQQQRAHSNLPDDQEARNPTAAGALHRWRQRGTGGANRGRDGKQKAGNHREDRGEGEHAWARVETQVDPRGWAAPPK